MELLKSKSLLSNYIELHLHIQPAFNFWMQLEQQLEVHFHSWNNYPVWFNTAHVTTYFKFVFLFGHQMSLLSVYITT